MYPAKMSDFEEAVDSNVKVEDKRRARADGCKKGTWSCQLEFFMTLICYVTALSSVWRFTYLCMARGGGAFLIPYVISIALCGMPLCYLEMLIGQFSFEGPVTVWKLCPIAKGIGWTILAFSVIVAIYFNTILAWILYYFGISFYGFSGSLPWSTCTNAWNTERCIELKRFFNQTSPGVQLDSFSPCSVSNITNGEFHRCSPSGQEFWTHHVLHLSEGTINWKIAACGIGSWLMVYLCLIKGIKSSGKVAYVCATAPYVFLLILLLRGVTLPGAIDGIKFFIFPNWYNLLGLDVWVQACLQSFYSLGPGFGGIIAMASYNRFNYSCTRVAVALPVICVLSSILAGLVVFSLTGFLAHRLGLTVNDVMTSGPNLVFLVFTEALTSLSPVWTILLFATLFLIGLGSQFVLVESAITGVVDRFPRALRRWKTFVTLSFCAASAALGMCFATEGGVYAFQLVDWYAGFGLFFVGMLECVVVSFFYGVKRFSNDVKTMLGSEPALWWKICWCFATPFLLLLVTLHVWRGMTSPSYGNYEYPWWAQLIGWCFALVPLLPLPIGAIHSMCREKGTFDRRFVRAFNPAASWGPKERKSTT